MTGAATLADALIAAGLSERERRAKTALFRRAVERWRVAAASPWTGAWWVPGRLELFGTHTDYAGGRSLVAAVPRGFVVLAAPRTDRTIRVTDAGTGGLESAAIPQDDQPVQHTGWRHYVEVTAARLARNFPGCTLGADIVFASDLPRAAGMSSSSALVVGIATALVHAGALRDRDEWQQNVGSLVDEAGYLACVENGRTFGRLTGDAGVGTHGGSEDHAAMLAGTAGALSAFSFAPLRHLETIACPAAWRVVVASSGIGAHKTGSERAAYNRLADGTRALLDLWQASGVERATTDDHSPDRPAQGGSLAAALASSTNATALLREQVRGASVADWPSASLLARLDHFVGEDSRVGQAVGALRQADADLVGRLAAESQADAEQLLENQVPETSALVRLGVETGAIAARSFGAGFGGSVWSIVAAADAAGFARRWLAAYRTACPAAAARAVVFESDPGPPVTRVG